jgi:general secretion pathway protein D
MAPRLAGRCLAVAIAGLLAGCHPAPVGLTPLAEPSRLQAAPPRVNSALTTSREHRVAFVDERAPQRPSVAPALPTGGAQQGGDVTLNFVDTDIREVARVILGNTLQLDYTIDPRVRGTATLATATPLPRSALLPALETLLNQNGATLVRRNGLYQVVPIAAAAVSNPVPNAVAGGGSQVIALRYASAAELAKVLQPYIAEGSKVTPDPAHNALIVAGDQASREGLIGLIRAFDVNALAGQSFALFPVAEGTAATSAGEVEKALQADKGAANSGLITVVPLPRVNAVLVASSQPRYIDAARRFFSLAGRVEDVTARIWHVYYVQNGDSQDLANLLQRAFTPQHVTAAAPPGTTPPGLQPVSMGSQGFQTGALGAASQGGPAGLGGGLAAPATPGATLPAAAPHPATAPPPATEPLSTEAGATENENRIRIISNPTNNALLIYATAREYAVIDGMLRKLDIVPLEVLIDATIAEVTLNDQLAYGMQFYLGHKLAGILTTAGPVPTAPATSTTGATTTGGATPTIITVGGIPTAMGANFPGFVFANGVREVLNALSDVTRVRVLSSPHMMVLDNQPARLQVGQQVPVLTGTATSTLVSGAPIVNSIDYHATGVIMQVTPHINSGGLVTLDIGQEVSDVAPPAANTATGSPTFDDRIVSTRVAVQDGQTVALAGLIRDNAQEGNSGIPFLKDVPVLGTLFSSQDNQRQRTELLVMLTPHVINNQQDARALTEDLRGQLINAALVPPELTRQPIRGSTNPNGL